MDTIVSYLNNLYLRFISEEFKLNKEEEKVNCPLDIYFPNTDIVEVWTSIKGRKYIIQFTKDTKCIFLYAFNRDYQMFVKSWYYKPTESMIIIKEVLDKLKQHHNNTKFCYTCNKFQYLSHWIPTAKEGKCASEVLHEFVLENEPCPICLSGACDYVSPCNHSFHRKCLVKALQSRQNYHEDEDSECCTPCPLCRQHIHLE